MGLLRILFIFSILIPFQVMAQDAVDTVKAYCSLTANENQQYKSSTTTSLEKLTAEAQSLATADGGATSKVIEPLKTQIESCGTKKNIADWACVETCSSEIKSFTDDWGQAANIGAAAANGGMLGDKCNTLSRMLSAAQQAMTLFQAACATGKSVCNSSCSDISARSKLVSDTVLKAVTNAQNQMAQACASGVSEACSSATTQAQNITKQVQVIMAELNNINSSAKVTLNKCSNYEKTKQSAIAGAAVALQGYMTAKKCADDNSSGTTAAADCSNAASVSYSSLSCQCVRGEKSAVDCQGIKIGANLNVPAVSVPPIGSSTNDISTATNPDLSGALQDPSLSAVKPTAAGAPPPTDAGGSSGLGGGSGSGSGSQAQDGVVGKRGLNANILGGFGSGGGGAGSGAGPGYDMDSNLKAYMPGGSKDPSRSIASQLAKEVTPQAGRSNWEKVQLRYRDNYSSLLSK